MPRIERVRELIFGTPSLDSLKQKTQAGWKLVAVEWEREVEGEEPTPAYVAEDVPYGLRVSDDCLRLEPDPSEQRVLIHMMDLIVQDHPLSRVASELNRGGHRTRSGSLWSPVSVFNMLPRLIDIGPRIFSSEEWDARRPRLVRAIE